MVQVDERKMSIPLNIQSYRFAGLPVAVSSLPVLLQLDPAHPDLPRPHRCRVPSSYRYPAKSERLTADNYGELRC